VVSGVGRGWCKERCTCVTVFGRPAGKFVGMELLRVESDNFRVEHDTEVLW